eukprot:COSAG01_NODE_36925_length_510_cov_18.058394_1_plen_37_part_01
MVLHCYTLSALRGRQARPLLPARLGLGGLRRAGDDAF